jgi:hypothetical protein
MANILTDLTEGVRRLQKFTKEMSELELKEEILNLKQLLLDVREELMAKDDQIREFLAKLQKKSETTEVLGFRFDLVEGQPSGLPYCPICEVKEGKMFRLIRRNRNYSLCANCKTLHNAGADGNVHGEDPPLTVNREDDEGSWLGRGRGFGRY